MHKVSFTKPDGEPCRAPARESGLCFAHDPALEAKRTEARRAGGLKRSQRHLAEIIHS